MQVLFEEHTSDAAFQLWDESGEFLRVPSATLEQLTPVEEPHATTSDESSAEERDELESLRQTLTRERDNLQNELQAVREELRLRKARITELWRISCGQVAEYDLMIKSKDEEIPRLKAQLAERRRRTPSLSDDDDAGFTFEPPKREETESCTSSG